MRNGTRSAALALAYAQEQSRKCRHWTELHNALFGIGGKIGELFTDVAERTAFAKTDQYAEILKLVETLREKNGDPPAIASLATQANGHISVRMPKSVHAALLAEADAEGVSLNQLCVSKSSAQLRSLVS